MLIAAEKRIYIHASIVIFVCFFAGIMMGMVLTGQVEGTKENWLLAHNEALINALLLFAIGAGLHKLALSNFQITLLSWCLVIMAYSNALFGLMRGFTGVDGYVFNDSLANNVAAFAGTLGVPMAVIAFSLVLYGAIKRQA